MPLSEIRDSKKIQLQDKVRRNDYGRYLVKASITKIRGFKGEDISLDFPVTALIGPKGSGKSAVLGAAGCAYKPVKQVRSFRRVQSAMSRCLVGALSMI